MDDSQLPSKDNQGWTINNKNRKCWKTSAGLTASVRREWSQRFESRRAFGRAEIFQHFCFCFRFQHQQYFAFIGAGQPATPMSPEQVKKNLGTGEPIIRPLTLRFPKGLRKLLFTLRFFNFGTFTIRQSLEVNGQQRSYSGLYFAC